MTDQTFSSLLAETVQAPRLSGTKVKTLTDLFTSALDTTHITTFFKLNRSLPAGGQARISSLYVFDALSRGVHKESTKGKKRGDAKRCLDGLEAVVESWVEGMTTAEGGGSWTEGKEKARKIIEIWKKTETFPLDTTERLAQRLNGSNAPVAGPSTTPPYEPGAPPPISPALPPLNPQVPEIEALSTKVSGGEGQASSSRSPSSSALPPDILKLLGLPPQSTPVAQSSSSATPPPNPGSAELAAILAKLPNNKAAPTAGVPASGSNTAAGPSNPLAALDLGQLAELAKVAQSMKSPPMPNHQTLPTPFAVPNGQPPQPHDSAAPAAVPAPYQHRQGSFDQPPHGYPSGDRDGGMPPGTSRNYGRVKPLRNPQAGMRDFEDRPPPGAGYGGRPDRDNSGQGQGWDRQRERARSRSPDRGWGGTGAGVNRDRDNGYGDRRREAPAPIAGSGRNDDFPSSRQRPPVPTRPPPAGPTLETFDMSMFNPGDPGSWSMLGEAWKRSKGSEPNQMDLMGWMQEKMMGGMGMNGGMGMAGGMQGGGGGGGWGQGGGGGNGGWQGGQGGY